MGWATAMAELVIPQSCAGCGAAGDVLCAACRRALREPPHLVTRRRDIGMPVFALGEYTALRRRLIIAMKEYSNQAVRGHVGAVVAAGLRHLQARGDIPHSVALVPAPTRPRSARLRGGDPVLHMCQSAAATVAPLRGCDLRVEPVLRTHSQAADQSELAADERWSNMRGAVALRAGHRLRGVSVVVVDDVVTTGATLAASAAVLRGAGAVVRAGLVLADAR